MVDFPMAVNPPAGVSYAAPLIDFTPLSQLGNQFYQGAKNRAGYDASQILKNGLPTTSDGQVDYAKAAQMLAASGDLPAVAQIAQIGAEMRPSFGPIGQNQLGIPQYGFADRNQRTVTPARTAPGADGGAPIGAGGGINPSLTGQAFLDAVTNDPTLGPGKAQMVKAIAEGRQPYPSGFLLKTPFGQWLTTAVGQYEPGLDATLIGQRATFNKQMGSSTPTSVGGQKNLMGTALGHLGELADAAVSLGNTAGPLPDWLPGSAGVAHGINKVGNSSTARSAQVNALNDAVQKFAGEVGKLYSGSSGGGIAEREDTRNRFSANLSPQEMAASLEMSKALIQSKLAALENQQDQIFGPNNKGRVDFLGANGRAAIGKIDAAIARLRGQAPPVAAGGDQQQAPAAPAGPQRSQAAPARPQGVSDAQILSEAKAAIAAGKDKATVLGRVRAWGVNPAGL